MSKRHSTAGDIPKTTEDVLSRCNGIEVDKYQDLARKPRRL